MGSLLLRNLIFTILQPGIVAGLGPWWLIQRGGINIWDDHLGLAQWSGLITGLAGAGITLYCIYQFATEGRGTLSPADPTKNLVARGLYRYSRNPMYIGVLMVLAGEALFTGYAVLWLYTGLIFLLFNLFVHFVEEPRLRRDFGEEYRMYCQSVNRWI